MNVRIGFPKRCSKGTFTLEDYHVVFDGYEQGDSFTSPVILDIDGFQWRLKIFPAGAKQCETEDADLASYMAFDLARCDDIEEEIKLEANICIEKNGVSLTSCVFKKYRVFSCKGKKWGWWKAIPLDELKETSDGPNVLTFRVEATMIHTEPQVLGHGEADVAQLKNQHTSALASDFKELLTSGKDADITLVVGNEERQAHKLILGARSSVFQTMFDSGMRENHTGRIELPDAPDVVDALLCYIYTGYAAFENAPANFLLDVLAAAHRLNIIDLINFCETTIQQKLTVDNVCLVASRADLLSLKKLKTSALDYIFAMPGRLSEVQQTIGFAELSKGIMRDIITLATGKKRPREETWEFANYTDWSKLRKSQLVRACTERSIEIGGIKSTLVERLKNWC